MYLGYIGQGGRCGVCGYGMIGPSGGGGPKNWRRRGPIIGPRLTTSSMSPRAEN